MKQLSFRVQELNRLNNIPRDSTKETQIPFSIREQKIARGDTEAERFENEALMDYAFAFALDCEIVQTSLHDSRFLAQRAQALKRGSLTLDTRIIMYTDLKSDVLVVSISSQG